jgi:trypsin-like peptidase
MGLVLTMKRLLALLGMVWLAGGFNALGQAPDVPMERQGRKEKEQEQEISDKSKELFSQGKALKLAEIKEQLKRKTCQLALPKPSTAKLSSREIWNVARQAHVRVGWAYLCSRCEDWHVNLAGGYFITADGVIATCHHVAEPDRDIKDGCLVAVDDFGNVHGVTEVLAANRYSDTCIVKIEGKDFKPLALNTNAYPGDMAYCYSDPLDHRGYFSEGIINRFYQFPGRRPVSAPDSAAFYSPTRLNVGTDWAPGSSGSAVLDECGNAIGHVSTIATFSDQETIDTDEKTERPTDRRALAISTMIVFHEAVAASDVLWIIKAP